MLFSLIRSRRLQPAAAHDWRSPTLAQSNSDGAGRLADVERSLKMFARHPTSPAPGTPKSEVELPLASSPDTSPIVHEAGDGSPLRILPASRKAV